MLYFRMHSKWYCCIQIAHSSKRQATTARLLIYYFPMIPSSICTTMSFTQRSKSCLFQSIINLFFGISIVTHHVCNLTLRLCCRVLLDIQYCLFIKIHIHMINCKGCIFDAKVIKSNQDIINQIVSWYMPKIFFFICPDNRIFLAIR